MSRPSSPSLWPVLLLGFAAGLAIGLLASPASGHENRAWVGRSVGSAGRKFRESGRKSAEQLRRSIDRNFPDLYKATEKLGENLIKD